MKKLVILGNSVAALETVEIIRSQENEFQVVFIPLEGCLPVVKEKYGELIVNQSKIKSILYKDKEFFVNHNIEIIDDKKVTRVNVTRNKIHFDDRSQMDFDLILIADTPDHRFEETKGSNKSGVFGFSKIKDVEQISTLVAINHTVTIQTDQWWGMELASMLVDKDKEIILSLSASNPLIHGSDSEFQEWLINRFHEKGINMLIDNPIVEFLGEGDLKAIRVKTGKVYATELVLFDKSKLDTRIFSEALELDRDRILVDEKYCSNLGHVLAADIAAVRSYEQWGPYGPMSSFLKYQGQVLAAYICQSDQAIEMPVPVYQFEYEGISLLSIGQVTERRGVTAMAKLNQDQEAYLKVYAKDGKLAGLVGFNVNIDPEDILQKIKDKWDIQAATEPLFSALNSPQNSIQVADNKEDSSSSEDGQTYEAAHQSNIAS